MKRVTVIAGLLGLGLTVWMLMQFGARSILSLIMTGGWGILAATLFHTVQVALSAQAWRTIAGNTLAPALSWRDYFLLRCVREGINNLLPVAQVGGEVWSSRLLARRGLGTRNAAAATICDLTLELLSQVLFTFMGLGLLLFLVKRSPITDELLESALIALAIGLALFISQWLGAVAFVEVLLVKIAGHLGWSGVDGIRGLHQAVLGLYKVKRNAVMALWLQFLAWALGAVEVCLILHFMGYDCSLSVGFVIEGVGEAAKSVGFAVPGALGVSEGGYLLIGSLFGISPALAIALSLIKRVREIAWGLPSLLVWQWLEHRWDAQHQAGCKNPLSRSGL
ncbi:flippase-like domain-containing protein [Acetobacter persici]|uniref:flippase-like domain-containing protein n=1 Tax=Acetobacter persici TaxID=1076596 RepID=UPI0020CE8BB1|nr:flippase-like domain-containing protein [Acetobacter persici]MCP9319867.1 flippase-like domain-containing protein [Acetobacter persici]